MRLRRLAVSIVAMAGALVVISVVPLWLAVLTPRWIIRGASIGFLWALIWIYVAAVPVALAGFVYGFIAVGRAWLRRDRGALVTAMRWVLFASSCVLGMIMMEAASAVRLRRDWRLPDLPTRFADDRRLAPGSAARNDLYIVVVGESSARGEPYQPWLSLGQIVGWQLEQVFPGRKIRVDVRAAGGFCLEQSILLLRTLKERPDAIIVFGGHNEFQTRFGWSRDVRYYVDESPRSTLALLDLARAKSSAATLILATLDRHRGEAGPPHHVTRQLVDRPICARREYTFLLDDFTRRLDDLAAYCNRIEAIPILVAPASNVGAFEPSRSIVSDRAGAGERAAFALEFERARAAESENPMAAIAAYRRLLDRQPEFAESHYRLARLLEGAGSWALARQHYVLARDLDAFPLRCPSDFLESIRIVAARHSAILIDGSEVLARQSPHGILNDQLFHDAHHLNLAGYVSLAQDLLDQLQKRRAFGWPASAPVPHIDLGACAQHFELDAAKWSTICERSGSFYARTAYVRYDPSERLNVAVRYDRASRDLAAGRPLSAVSPPSLKRALLMQGPAAIPSPESNSSPPP